MAINTNELLKILAETPASQNLMLVGRHGIGKSEILTRYFQQLGIKVNTLFLGQMSDPGDLIGLPRLDEATGKTVFMPPYWFPTDGKPIVLFLDELNRARPEVLQTIMDLALNRKLAGRALPEGSRLIAAVNEGEEYQLTAGLPKASWTAVSSTSSAATRNCSTATVPPTARIADWKSRPTAARGKKCRTASKTSRSCRIFIKR